jgi:hypothetical protein
VLKFMRALTVVFVAQVISACTGEQTYNSLQGARENECRAIPDAVQRDQCYAEACKSYDKFNQERNESRK